MRIVIASTYVPFVKGGGVMIVDSLEEQLRKRGFEVEVVKIPLRSAWFELLDQTVALRLLDLTESSGQRIDRLITIRYPAYAIPHPNKINWFIHHHRTAYDLYGTEYHDMPNTPEALKIRQMIIHSDTLYLKEAKKTYTISEVLVERLRKFNHIEADGVVYQPLPDASPFYKGASGDYFLYTARLTPVKRQTIAIEAMRYTRSNFKLMLAGPPDVEWYGNDLKALAEKYGVADRVQFTGWIDEKTKADLTANAFAALYVSYQEDGYGYSSLEAFHSSKAVITLNDSGGTNELIKHGFNGLILEPNPHALADGMEALWADKQRAIEMGDNGLQTLAMLHIDWDYVIERLTE